MAHARGEIAKRHPEGPADFRVEVMHGASKAVGRQPLRQGVRLDEGAIDLVGLRGQDAVQSNGVGHGCFSRAGAPTMQPTATSYLSLRPFYARVSGPGPFPKKQA